MTQRGKSASWARRYAVACYDLCSGTVFLYLALQIARNWWDDQ